MARIRQQERRESRLERPGRGRDIRDGLRRLVPHPGLTLLAGGTLALALTTSTAGCSRVEACRLPFPGADGPDPYQVDRNTPDAPFGAVSWPDHEGADSTTIILLGTGYPTPLPDQQGPATAVVVGDRIFLFDAGTGVVRQLAAAGYHLNPPAKSNVFITHLHTDHTLGMADVIFTPWARRDTPLQVFGPPGLQAMVSHLYEAYAADIDVRVHGLQHLKDGGYRVDVHETHGGVVFDSAGVKVTAFKVPHGSWDWAFGYRIDTPTRSIVISGDTRPSDELVKQAMGVDVLVHEVYAANTTMRGDTTNNYFLAFHTSARQLGALAARARPKLVLLTHVIRRRRSDEQLIAAVHAGGYAGPVIVGKDLGRY